MRCARISLRDRSDGEGAADLVESKTRLCPPLTARARLPPLSAAFLRDITENIALARPAIGTDCQGYDRLRAGSASEALFGGHLAARAPGLLLADGSPAHAA